MPVADIASWRADVESGDPIRVARSARKLATERSKVDPKWEFAVHDKWWTYNGELTPDLMEGTGTDPRNNVPTATIKLKGSSPHIGKLMDCSKTMVGVTAKTGGMESAFYVKSNTYEFDKGAWTNTVELRGIWDVLNYLQIWPTWWLPLAAQPLSHAVFIGPLVTVCENMVSECSIRIQSGIWEFVNNALSLNLDVRTWFATLLRDNPRIFDMLKTPMYVVRTNPLTDGSPLVAKTVRMESCGTVIKDLTGPYGVDVRVDLWQKGMPQPNGWANLTQATYVVTVKDRSQITGPTKTVLDSAIRTVVDLAGSLFGNAVAPIISQARQQQGVFIAPRLGVNYAEPWVVVLAPDEGEDGPISKCTITDHTPEGWQHIIGGKSPKWLNDLINSTLSWLIDSIMIVIGFTGVPSNLLDGFMNDAFLAFALVQHYDRRQEVGPYHPAIERFHATNSSPYNIEALFEFVKVLWDSRGWTSAQFTFRNGEVYTLGKDIMRGSLVSLVYFGRKKMLTDFVENVMWRIGPDMRDVWIQVGDGKAEEAPLAKHERFITGLQEAFNVVSLAPSSS